MPINCPIPFGETRNCRECRNYWFEYCNYYLFEPVPVKELLTDKEYTEYFSKRDEEVAYHPIKRYEFDQLKGQFIHLQNKYNTLINKNIYKSKSIKRKVKLE